MKRGARWIRNIAVGFAIYVVAVMLTGAVHSYGCISRIDQTQVFDAAMRAYLDRVSRRSDDAKLQFIVCSQPESVVDYFYGIPLGWEWEAFCSYKKKVSTSSRRTDSISMSVGELASGNRI